MIRISNKPKPDAARVNRMKNILANYADMERLQSEGHKHWDSELEAWQWQKQIIQLELSLAKLGVDGSHLLPVVKED